MIRSVLTISKGKNNLAFQLILFFLTFSYLFNLKFLNFEWIPATRLVLILCFLTLGLKLAYFFKGEIERNSLFYVAQVSAFIYIIAQIFFLPTDLGMLSKIVVFLVFTIYVAGAGALIFNGVNHFLKVLVACCTLQACMVFISFVFPGYREWLSGVMVEGGNIPFSDPFRVPGFSTGSGASLALALSIGVFSAMSLFWKDNRLSIRLFYFILAIFITSSCIFVGKLGLFLCSFYILSFLLVSFKSIKHVGVIFLCLSGVAFLVFLFFDIDFETISYPLERSFSIFIKGEDSSVEAIRGMPIPPIDIETIAGTGLASTPSGLNASGSDVGYIQTYYGFGLVFSIVFYLSMFLYLLKNIYMLENRSNRLICFLFFVPLFIIEFKEPFVTKISQPIVLFILIFLSRREGDSHRN